MPAGNSKTPSPRDAPNVGRLDCVTSIRREMSRVYKEARRGKLETSRASKLVFILATIVKVLEGSDLESRMAALESKIEERSA
jgi:hypothetical protein